MTQRAASRSGEVLKHAGTPVSAVEVKAWFSDPHALSHYMQAAMRVGLWRSEARLFERVFTREDRLLDVGCGTGRIALGLWRLRFRDLVGVDCCAPMVEQARELAAAERADIPFHVGDATALPFPEASMSGAIFGFNGLMQIPGAEERLAALREIRRVVRPGGRLVFTTHDRDLSTERAKWEEERACWERGDQDPRLVDFGDRILNLPEGTIFMHLPDRAEILAQLRESGWRHELDMLRCQLANEPMIVREFADECRFWVAVNP